MTRAIMKTYLLQGLIPNNKASLFQAAGSNSFQEKVNENSWYCIVPKSQLNYRCYTIIYSWKLSNGIAQHPPRPDAVIDVKWGIASPADPGVAQVRWIRSNSIMMDTIKIHDALHAITGFLSVFIDWFDKDRERRRSNGDVHQHSAIKQSPKESRNDRSDRPFPPFINQLLLQR